MSTAIVWLRNTLRVHDNPLLDWAHGSEEIGAVIPVFVLDTGRGMGEEDQIGPNRMRFLYDSLTDLDDRLRREYSARLLVLEGRPEEAVPLLAEELGPAGWLLCDYQTDPKSRGQIGEIGNLRKILPRFCRDRDDLPSSEVFRFLELLRFGKF